MHDTNPFFLLLAFLAAAIIILPICYRLRVNPIIGYMLAGIALGRHGLCIISNSDDISFLAELGVVFLLFAIGLDLTIDRIKQMGMPALKVGIAQIVLCSLTFIVAGRFFNQSLQASIIIGSSLALSSTALCIRLLIDNKEHTSSFGQMAISILLVQDLAVVPIMTLTPLFHLPGLSIVNALFLAIIKALIAIIAMVFFGRYVLRQIYRIVSKTRNAELFTATTLFVLFGCSYLTAFAGLSIALGAFLAGLLLAETQYHHQVESDMHPFRGIFLGLFFTTVGINIDVGFIVNNLMLVLALSLAIIGLKSIVVFVLGRCFHFPIAQSIRASILLSQGGEFAFIVLGLAIKEELINEGAAQLLFGAIALSMVSTPFLLNLITPMVNKIFPSETSLQLFPHLRTLKDHVIIVGFGRIGQNIAALLEKQNVVFVGLDINEHVVAKARKTTKAVFYGDATHVRLLESLGVEQARVMVISIDDPVMSLRICEHMLKQFCNTKLVVRAHDEHHAQQLAALGIHAMALETTEISVQISALALKNYGLSDDSIETIIQQFRQDHFGLV